MYGSKGQKHRKVYESKKMIFKLPTNTDWMVRQMSLEPMRQYAEEVFGIVFSHKPDYKNALEIGAAWGVSTLSILRAGSGKLTSVDILSSVETPNEVKANHLQGRHEFICQDSHDFWKENKQAFDLIYIDGSHLYEDVINDLFRAWEWLTPDGLLVIDDYVHKNNNQFNPNAKEPTYGVSFAIMQLIQKKHITKIGATDKVFYTWRSQP